MAVSHLAPESMRDTWPTDWEKLAVDEARWRFMRKVDRWQDEEEKERRCSSAHDANIQTRELRMTRKAAVDELAVEFINDKAKCNGVHSFGFGGTMCKMQLSEAQRV